jgi:hypothetical protein
MEKYFYFSHPSLHIVLRQSVLIFINVYQEASRLPKKKPRTDWRFQSPAAFSLFWRTRPVTQERAPPETVVRIHHIPY